MWRRTISSSPLRSRSFFIIQDFQYPLRKVILWDIVVSPFRRLERESGLPHLSAPDRRLEDTGVQRFERLIVSDRISLSNQASSRLSLCIHLISFYPQHIRGQGLKVRIRMYYHSCPIFYIFSSAPPGRRFETGAVSPPVSISGGFRNVCIFKPVCRESKDHSDTSCRNGPTGP